jgi:hypothetical protein
MFITASENVISSNQYDMVNQWLDINTNMQCICEHARLLDKLLYLQLQQSLWTEYFDVGTSEDGVWASEVHEKINRQVENKSSSSTIMNPLSFVIHYRMNIEQELQKADNELHKHLNHFKRIIGQKSQVRCVDLSIVLKAFVRRGQHKLNAEFECKKRSLHFDWEDHRLTKAFFDFKPTREQV